MTTMRWLLRIGMISVNIYVGNPKYKFLRDSTGTGELLSRGRGTCMGYLNNRFLPIIVEKDPKDDDDVVQT